MERMKGYSPEKMAQVGMSVVLGVILGIAAYAAAKDGNERNRKIVDECGADRSRCVRTVDYVPVGIFSGNPSMIEVANYATMTPPVR